MGHPKRTNATPRPRLRASTAPENTRNGVSIADGSIPAEARRTVGAARNAEPPTRRMVIPTFKRVFSAASCLVPSLS